jgi:hypothetical protein
MRLILPYVAFLMLIVAFSYLFIDPNLFYLRKFFTGFAFINRELVSMLFSGIAIIFFLFYLFFIRLVDDSNFWKIILISVVILVISYPAVISYDIFNYLLTAKLLYFYQENPYIIMPIEIINEPNLIFTHAANKVALYGPGWLGLSGIPYAAGLGNFLLTLFTFKVFVGLFYFGIVYLLYRFTKDPRRTALFALNPLVLIETFVSGHNDVVMMFFALSGVLILTRNKLALAFIFLLASISIKYATIFLLPVFLLVLYMSLKKRKINWDRIFSYSYISMMVIFFLSTFRGEIYPWYAVWFLTFIPLIKSRFATYLSIFLSFVLLFRYIPFMYTGNHFGITPYIRELITLVPIILFILFYKFKINK